MNPTEAELISGSAKGDRKSQRALYDLYAGKMMVVAMRYSKSTLEAEDILQESFIKVFRSIKKFRRDSSLYYWIKRIVVNTALNHNRSKLYLYPMVDVQELQGMADKELTVSNLNYQELLELVQELPTGCQVIFNLYAIEGFTHKDIAEQLGITVGTSKSQYARAKELLRAKLEKMGTVRYEGLQ